MTFFKKEIKEQIKNHRVDPPQESWEFISKELNSKQSNLFYKYRWGAVAAVLLLFLCAWWFFSTPPKSNEYLPKIVREEALKNNSNKNEKLLKSKSLEKNQVVKQNDLLKKEVDFQANKEKNNSVKHKKNQTFNEGHHVLVKNENTFFGVNDKAIARQKDDLLKQEINRNNHHLNLAIITNQVESLNHDEIKENQSFKKELKLGKALEDFSNSKTDHTETIVASAQKEKEPILELEEENLDEEAVEEAFEIDQKKKFMLTGYAGNWDVLKSNPNLISEELEHFSTESKNAIEYGVMLTYAPSSKLKISGGLGILSIEQSSNEIPIDVQYNLESNDIVLKVDVPKVGLQKDAPVVSEFRMKALSGVEVPQIGTINQKIRFIQIPVELSYDFMSIKNWNWSVVGGTNLMLLDKNNIELNYLKKTKDASYLSNAPNFSVSLKLGTKLTYQISSGVGLFIQPEALQMLHSFGDVDNSLSIGFITGMRIGL